MQPEVHQDVKFIVQSFGADPDDEAQLWHVMECLALMARLGELSLRAQR
jgi:hypothetical protein